jgi:P4 family phage/plasmid primase-like protien
MSASLELLTNSEPLRKILDPFFFNGKKSAPPTWPEIEAIAAKHLHERIGPLRCTNHVWYVQQNGVWNPTDHNVYRPLALEVLPDAWRTEARSSNVMKRLEAEQQVTRDQFCGAAKFDADGNVLVAVQNGTLLITPNELDLLPTDPAQGFTAALPVAWEPEATAPLFFKTIRELLPDPADPEILLDVVATALIPDCRFEAALVCLGSGGTGKSTIFVPIVTLLGPRACSTLNLKEICNPNGYFLSQLNHKLLNLATELNSLEMEDSGIFKQLVSGEPFMTRDIYGAPFEMRSTATLIFLANNLPRFKHGTTAEVRRLRFVCFNHTIEKPDITLKDRLPAEAPGVFAELVRRAQELLGGRRISQAGTFGQETSERFAISNDPVSAFVQSCCQVGQDLECDKDLLCKAFDAFRESNGISEKFDKATFLTGLYNRFSGVKPYRKRCGQTRLNLVQGIELLPS